MRILLSTAFISAFLLWLPACAHKKVSPPEVQLLDLALSETSLLSTSFDAEIELRNSSPDAISLRGSRYRLKVKGVNLGFAASGERLEIPAFGSVKQRVSFDLSHLSVATNVQRLFGTGTFSYDVQGTLFLNPSGELAIRNTAEIDLAL